MTNTKVEAFRADWLEGKVEPTIFVLKHAVELADEVSGRTFTWPKGAIVQILGLDPRKSETGD